MRKFTLMAPRMLQNTMPCALARLLLDSWRERARPKLMQNTSISCFELSQMGTSTSHSRCDGSQSASRSRTLRSCPSPILSSTPGASMRGPKLLQILQLVRRAFTDGLAYTNYSRPGGAQPAAKYNTCALGPDSNRHLEPARTAQSHALHSFPFPTITAAQASGGESRHAGSPCAAA